MPTQTKKSCCCQNRQLFLRILTPTQACDNKFSTFRSYSQIWSRRVLKHDSQTLKIIGALGSEFWPFFSQKIDGKSWVDVPCTFEKLATFYMPQNAKQMAGHSTMQQKLRFFFWSLCDQSYRDFSERVKLLFHQKTAQVQGVDHCSKFPKKALGEDPGHI